MAKQTQKKKDTNGITKDQCRMVTSEFRVSFPHLHKAQSVEGSKPKYSVTMLFPKDQEIVGTTPDGQETSLKRIFKNAKISEFGPKENWPEKLEMPISDGDDPKYADKEGYKGHWVVKATSNEESKPGLVDHDMNPIINPADFYPGCYARAYIFARVWEFMGKQGVQLIVDHVQKLRDGKSFGGKKPVDQVFKPVGSTIHNDDADDDQDEMTF